MVLCRLQRRSCKSYQRRLLLAIIALITFSSSSILETPASRTNFTGSPGSISTHRQYIRTKCSNHRYEEKHDHGPCARA
jgi:hypothetical protein